MKNEEKLKTYIDKRDFKHTPEPSGDKIKNNNEPIFVIQKHDATNLHYDFRLEMDGVLKSWAVPKGPSTDPSVKRLAIETEDHPLDYGDFEGVIPEGNYGAGEVIIWDKGTYHYEDDMEKAYENGHIVIKLYGEKIEGGYALIRTGKKSDGKWLLIKENDELADKRRKPVHTEKKSVKSGKTIEDIKEENNENKENH